VCPTGIKNDHNISYPVRTTDTEKHTLAESSTSSICEPRKAKRINFLQIKLSQNGQKPKCLDHVDNSHNEESERAGAVTSRQSCDVTCLHNAYVINVTHGHAESTDMSSLCVTSSVDPVDVGKSSLNTCGGSGDCTSRNILFNANISNMNTLSPSSLPGNEGVNVFREIESFSTNDYFWWWLFNEIKNKRNRLKKKMSEKFVKIWIVTLSVATAAASAVACSRLLRRRSFRSIIKL